MMRLEHVKKSYGGQPVLRDATAEFLPGFTALTGGSGAGKTTLLRLLAGLEEPDAGTVYGTENRKICYLFQEPRLLPWLTAEQNVRMVQEKGAPVPAAEWLRRVGLEEDAQKLPGELSGGMCQRVALARALAFGGDCVLLDEPFKELDSATRAQMLELVRREAAGKPVVFVTHSAEEARALCDHALLLADGCLQSIAPEAISG